MNNKKTFTLIEMLIVIVIIGILAAALIPRLQAVQGRARDSERKVDLRAIYTANEIYLTDNGRYAPAIGNANYSASGLQAWLAALSGVMTSIPQDPINNGWQMRTVTGDYTYFYGSVYTTPVNAYDMQAKLENANDPDRWQVKLYTYDYPATSYASGLLLGPRGKLIDVSPFNGY